MNLRLRLIVAFFLLSVVPLGAVTLYTYASNASAIREAASREAQTLAGELSERMTLVTAQLSQRFERLMEIPAEAPPPQPSSVSAAIADAVRGAASTVLDSTAMAAAVATAQATAQEAARVASELGEVAILLDNIEIRGFGRGRGGPGSARGFPNAVPLAPRPPAPPAPGPAMPDATPGRPSIDQPPPPPSGRGGRNPVADGRGAGGSNGNLRIDLGATRRAILKQVFPNRENWDQLSSDERELILARVNEAMLGVRQSLESLKQSASAEVADARAAAAAAAALARRQTASAQSSAPMGAGLGGSPDRPAPRTAPSSPGATPSPSTATTDAERQSSAAAAPLERSTAMSGRRMDVRVVRDGEVVGQVNAEINLPNLLATVFTTTRRDRGEVPFAVDGNGALYTPTEADRSIVTALDSSATRPETPPGTEVLPDWVVVTTADPTGSGLKFGVARPLGDALDDLRRSSTLNASSAWRSPASSRSRPT
jgi:hypothetical protein